VPDITQASQAGIEACLRGEALYGDDFDSELIAAWHDDEMEGYSLLGAGNAASYRYVYHALNTRHGFRHLPAGGFESVLGFGSAYGEEFAPLAGRIARLTIVDPSDAFPSTRVHGIPTEYVKPAEDGTLPFPDASFDLVTCLGVLHHIPNVTYVVGELARCLSPAGHFLIREPVVSLGDWREPRRGLTRRERGIPLWILRRIHEAAGLSVVHEALCMFPLVPRFWRLFGRAAYNAPTAAALDDCLARLFAWNLRYHRVRPWEKLCPTNVFSVLQKRR